MDLVGISIPHIAVVDTEDVSRFAAIAKAENLTIISTAEVLPGPAEVLRRGPPRRRIRRRGRELPGWVAQQIVKLAVSDLVESQVIVPLDSDAFFLRKVDPATSSPTMAERFSTNLEVLTSVQGSRPCTREHAASSTSI